MIIESVQSLPVDLQMRVYSYASCIATGECHDLLTEKSFICVHNMIINGTIGDDFNDINPIIKKDLISLSYPLRVNWGGSWTDTPPYCLENGGAVVNAAVKINKVLPVKVTIERLQEPKVVLEYFDSGICHEFRNLDELSDFSDPLDHFSLLKSALSVCSLIPMPGVKQGKNIFEKLGGGIFLSTGVVGIPKGSGLGTSSILLAACIKGLFDFVGKKVTNAEIFRRVLLAEQLMGTGGGWQDQAGGMTNGIKLVTSRSGYKQNIKVKHLNVPEKFLKDLNERFCLVYSGQRRLGRTVLREIMGGYIQSDPLFLEALKETYSLAEEMSNNIESGQMDAFIENLNRQTKLIRTLDTGYISECISQILDVCDDMISGKMICGAGGGGFIQIVLKEGFNKQELSERLKNSFPQQGIDVWDCDFI